MTTVSGERRRWTVTASLYRSHAHLSLKGPMDVLGSMETMGHEQVVFCHEPSCGYQGIIAIHDTTLGPALGGTRFWQYASDRRGGRRRAAPGARHDLQGRGGRPNLGGGKSVIIGDNKRDRPRGDLPGARPLRRVAGRPLHHRRGLGTCPADMEYVRLETEHVAGLAGPVGRSVAGHRRTASTWA